MPNLENLKKQAKQYLRWHRDGYYPVAAQIRSALPRYRDLTDRQVMARKLAFESWDALRRGIQIHVQHGCLAILSARSSRR